MCDWVCELFIEGFGCGVGFCVGFIVEGDGSVWWCWIVFA